jgi:hypothetical protein
MWLYYLKENNENFSLSLSIICISVVLLYYLKFGAFPRQETRFILPIVPYLIILFSPVFGIYKKSRKIYNPDFISVNSIYYNRFLDGGDIGELYPNIRAFFEFLLKKNEQYEIVFDESAVIPPIFAYPREIDCLNSRITILKKNEQL